MVNSLKGDGKAIFTVFIGAIIAVVFLASIADSVFTQSNTFTVSSENNTAPATNASIALTGRELIGTPVTQNASNVTGLTLQDLGVFIDERIINGIKTVALTVNQTGSAFVGETINVTYEFGPDGYLERQSDRSIAGLIVLFGALAGVVFVLVVFIKNGSFGDLISRVRAGRRK
ncbi:hypothetical protein LCGC14_0546160 [marine sediment metagenome]|uniref:Uncharacterized protein n=1 Tax=marine sediment metagenome TaxID=412755 RepID=A0A0F9UCT7_9ZZZZ